MCIDTLVVESVAFRPEISHALYLTLPTMNPNSMCIDKYAGDKCV